MLDDADDAMLVTQGDRLGHETTIVVGGDFAPLSLLLLSSPRLHSSVVFTQLKSPSELRQEQSSSETPN